MSTISKIIFNNADHYVTSAYGYRGSFTTSAGTTNSFHNGTDYGTNGKKLPQYAVEDGYVFAAAKASDGANYVWVVYPRIKLAMLHYHLDSYKVKKGQKVTKGTLLGYTGTTGKSTGIHLHLGIRVLSKLTTAQINSMTWENLRKCDYTDPEQVKYTAATTTTKTTTSTTTVKTNGTNTYKVTASLLRVRKGAGTLYGYKKFKDLSTNAQAQILKLNNNKSADGLVKGCTVTVSEIKNTNWGKIPSGWICLKYCTKV